MQIGGGLGEEYMHAPSLNIGGGAKKGGQGGFIASVLDLLGIHRQVAKGPKEGEAQAPESPQAPVDKPQPPGSSPTEHKVGLTVLDDAEAAFQPLTPRASRFGFNFLPLNIR